MRPVWPVLAVVLALVFAQGAAAVEPVKVGVIAPLTGTQANIGVAVVNGIKLAVKLANEENAAGRPIQLIVYDDRNMPDEAVAAARRLIFEHQAKVIIGSVGSSSTAAIQQLTMREGIPLVTPVSLAPKLSQIGDKYFFRVTATTDMREEVFAVFVSRVLKVKTIAFLASNEDLGRSTVEAAEKKYAKIGGPRTVYKAFYEPGSTDFTAEITKIKSVAPDALYIVADSVKASIIVKQARAAGLQIPVLASGEAGTDQFLRLTGPAAEGVYIPLDWSTTFEDEESQRFLTGYVKEYGKPPETKFAVQGWEAAWIVAYAIGRVQGPVTSEAIRDQLRKTNWKGPRGVWTFDENGDPKVGSFIVQVRNGRFVPVYP